MTIATLLANTLRAAQWQRAVGDGGLAGQVIRNFP
jgi:hypothetical protein